MEEDNIIIAVDLNLEDAVYFQKEYFHKLVSPAMLIIISTILLLISIVSIISEPPFGHTPALTAAFLVIPALFLFLETIGFKKGAANSFNTNKLAQKTQKYDIGAEDIKVSTESSNIVIRWNELYRAREAKEGFMLFTSKQQAHYIPKRYFVNYPGQIELMRKYISKVPTPKEDRKNAFSFLKGSFLIYIIIFVIVFFFISILTSPQP